MISEDNNDDESLGYNKKLHKGWPGIHSMLLY